MQVVVGADGGEVELPFTEAGRAVHSASAATGLDINGLSTAEAKDKVRVWGSVAFPSGLCPQLSAVEAKGKVRRA